MARPRILDLYCGAGGAARGYWLAGFELTGVDIVPQPRYPYQCIQADALEYLREHWHEFDAIHASPPCQRFSLSTFLRNGRGSPHLDLVVPTLSALYEIDRPWIVENVPRAPLGYWNTWLCGLMFGLKVLRHRRFACSSLILSPPHPSHRGVRIGVNGFACVAGHGDAHRRMRLRIPPECRNKASWSRAMGIDWMTRDELAQAVPPAYTEYLGRQLLRQL